MATPLGQQENSFFSFSFLSPAPSLLLPERRRLRWGLCPHAAWDVGSGCPQLSPRWRQWLSLPCCLNNPEPFGPCHLRAGPGSLRGPSAPAAGMKVTEERSLRSRIRGSRGCPGYQALTFGGQVVPLCGPDVAHIFVIIQRAISRFSSPERLVIPGHEPC